MTPLLAIVGLLTAFAAGTSAAQGPYQLFDVTKFGAVGDGRADDGPPVEQALAAAAAASAAGARVTVRFPRRGRRNAATVYAVRRPLALNASNSYFEVQRGVTLRWLFDTDLSYLDAASPKYWPDLEDGGHAALLDVGPAYNQPRLVNVTLGGGGSLDGSGFMWWPLVYHRWEYGAGAVQPEPAAKRWGPVGLLLLARLLARLVALLLADFSALHRRSTS